MGVQWTKEDPEGRHQGFAVAVDAAGDTWPNPDHQEWWALFDGSEPPEAMFGLRAMCEGCGWRSDLVAAFTRNDAGQVDIDASEGAAFGPHHDHVRQVMGVAESRELRRETRKLLDEIAYGPGLSEIDRVKLFTNLLQLGEQYRTAAVRFARNDGANWVELGSALGTSKQAAQQRYQRQVDAANAAEAAHAAERAEIVADWPTKPE